MNVKNLVLGLGIVIVFALVLWQGIEAFYPSPQYNEYCPERTSLISTQQQCEIEGGLWQEYSPKPTGTNETGYCDVYYYCNQEWQDAEKEHSKVVFFIALIVGIIALIAGYFILSIEPVGSALMASGVWAFFYGTVVNWRNFSNIWRFLLLLVALALLIWIALRSNRKHSKRVRKR